MKANLDHFKSVYMNDRWKLGFETADGESWLLATLYDSNEEKGVFVDPIGDYVDTGRIFGC